MGAQGIWATGRQAWRDERARARTLVRSEEVDFLPAAIEIVERPVSPTARYTAWVLMLGLAVALLWLIFGQIDVVASAPGQLIPADNVKLIQPADAGVVRSILVRDNQSVHAGQALLELLLLGEGKAHRRSIVDGVPAMCGYAGESGAPLPGGLFHVYGVRARMRCVRLFSCADGVRHSPARAPDA